MIITESKLKVTGQINLKTSFDVPEGRYCGTITSVFHPANDTSRLRIQVAVKGIPNARIQYMAAKTYQNTLTEGSQLLTELRNIRGIDFTPEEFEAGEIDYVTLEGTEVEFYIEHVYNDGWKKPFVHIREFFPVARCSNPRLKRAHTLTVNGRGEVSNQQTETLTAQTEDRAYQI